MTSRGFAGFSPVVALRALLTGLALLIVAAGPAQADWRKAESAHFVVYSEGSERELRDYVVKLETFDFMLRSRFGLPTDAPVTRRLPIYLVGAPDMRLLQPRADRMGLAGFYSASSEDIFAVALRTGGQSVLFHEYFHHFMFQNFSAAYPAWLVEGFAEYYSTAEVRDGGVVEVGRPDRNAGAWLANAEWTALPDLLSKRYGEIRRGEQQATYYPLSWLLTHWFLSDPERSVQLSAYMQAVGRGGDPIQTMTEVTGLSLPDLERALRRHLRNSLPFLRLTYEVPAVEVTVERLAPVAEDLLVPNQLLKIGVAADRRAEMPGLVRAAATRHADDPLARLALGHAELHFGDRQAGEDILLALIETHPDTLFALQLLAQTHLSLAEETEDPAVAAALVQEARGYLARAYALDSTDYATVYLLARSRVGGAGYPTQNDLNTWIVAVQLAPQLPEVRIGAAQALMLAGRQPEAIILLRPVAASPHGGGAARIATTLIEAAERGETAVALPETDLAEGEEGEDETS